MKIKVIRIPRTKAIELVEGSKGRFMSLTCNTKNTKNRVFNCIYRKTTKAGYAHVTERGQGIKAVDLRTLSEVRTNGNIYKVV